MYRNSSFVRTAATFGLVFLYVPIVLVIFFSFSASPVTSVWGGFSLKWYGALFQNETFLSAASVSLGVAALSASLSVILGTMSAVILVRLSPRFKGLFGVLATAPLIMPEVITGLAFLMFFVSLEQTIGWPQGRGIQTMTIAHTTLSMAYVIVLVRARLLELDHSLEEAAKDLGARPMRVFFLVTLPIIMPTLISSWLLAFALSLDDLVISSFTTGPGSFTLPMVIFSSIRLGLTPEINALSTIIIIFVVLCVAIAGLFMRRTYR